MIKSWVKDGDYTILNVVCCAAAVVIASIQLLTAVSFIYSLIPIPLSPLVSELFPRHRQLVLPEREMFLYRCFILSVALAQGLLLWRLRSRLMTEALYKSLLSFVITEAVLLFLILFAVFKGFVYGFPVWTKVLAYALLLIALLNKLFWPEIRTALARLFALVKNPSSGQIKFINIAFPAFIILLLFIPDLQAVVGRMYMGDCLHHMDTALVAPAWVYLKGGMLNIDVYAHYGIGMPILLGLLTKALGVFSYEGIVGAFVWMTIIYFIICYFFLKSWLKSIPAAVAGVLLAVKWQVFHPSNYPLVYTYPYSTVIRFFLDVVILSLMLAHLRLGKTCLLWAASFLCGLCLFLVSDTGLYITLTFMFYLCCQGIMSYGLDKKSWLRAGVNLLSCSAIIAFSTMAWFYAFQGHYLWSSQFWANMMERVQLFFAGHGNLPMYSTLLEGEYLASFMGFAIPVVYCMGLIIVLGLCFLGKIDRRHILLGVVCFYGLGLHHYYVCRSVVTSYYTVGVPFVFVLCYIARQVSLSWSVGVRQKVWGVLAVTALFALVTNHYYLSYPNLLGLSPSPIVDPAISPRVKGLDHYFNHISGRVPESWKLTVNSLKETDEGLKIEKDFKDDRTFKAYFKSEFDFSEDARLIARLTKPDDHVAILSSFETRILTQADRKPFFYYFPIMDSRPMRMRDFPMSSLWTTARLSLTMKELSAKRPEYIFMERILLNRQVPQVYQFLCPELLTLLAYISQYYAPAEEGRYLTALKRKQ